jgi:hypothetical protein
VVELISVEVVFEAFDLQVVILMLQKANFVAVGITSILPVLAALQRKRNVVERHTLVQRDVYPAQIIKALLLWRIKEKVFLFNVVAIV